MGPDVARSFACRAKALANRHIGDDPVPSGAAVFADLPPPFGCDREFSYNVCHLMRKPMTAKSKEAKIADAIDCHCRRYCFARSWIRCQ